MPCDLKCRTIIQICRFMSSLISFAESRLKSELIPRSSACRAALDHLLLFFALIKEGVRKRRWLFKCEGKERVSVCVWRAGGQEGRWMGLYLCIQLYLTSAGLSDF